MCLLRLLLLQETLHKHNEKERSNGDSFEKLETSGYTDANEKENPKKSLLKNWPLMSAITGYCIFSLHDMAYSEVFHLYIY